MSKELLRGALEAIGKVHDYHEYETECAACNLITRIMAELAKPARGVVSLKTIRDAITKALISVTDDATDCLVEDAHEINNALVMAVAELFKLYTPPTSQNPERMTREEFDRLVIDATYGDSDETIDLLWSRIQAIQNALFVPDEQKRPDGAMGFFGCWWFNGSPLEPGKMRDGEFFIPAKGPLFRSKKPLTERELTYKFDALPIEEKRKLMEGKS